MADYTRLIELKVKDTDLGRALKKLNASLESIDKKLDRIANKGFKGITSSADRATKSVSKLENVISRMGKGPAGSAVRGRLERTVFGAAGVAGLSKAIVDTQKLFHTFNPAVAAAAGNVLKLTAATGAWIASSQVATGAAIGLAGAYTILGGKGLAQSIRGFGLLAEKVVDVGTKLKNWGEGTVLKASAQLGNLDEKIKWTTASLIELGKAEGLKGLKSLLSTAVVEQERLLSSSVLYVAQVHKVREIEAAVNKELIARQRILDGIVRKEGVTAGPGLAGLQTALKEQEAILNRMLTTEEGFSAQVAKVKSIEELINEELRQRDLLMGKINIKEEKSLSLLQRTKNVAGAVGGRAVSSVRPGRGIERRAVQVGGVAGLAGLGAFSNTAAGGALGNIGGGAMGLASKGMGALGFSSVARGITDTKIALGGLAATAKTVAGISVLNPAAIAALGVAWVALGEEGFKRAFGDLVKLERAAKKTTTSLFSFGKANPAIRSLNMELQMSKDAMRQLATNTELVANARKKLAATRADISGSGFAKWSGDVDRNIPIEKAVRRNTLLVQKRNERNTAKIAQLMSQRMGMDMNAPLLPPAAGTQYGAPIGPQQLPMANRLGFGKNASNKGMFYSQKGMAGRVGGGLSSALIGGGFPLLFGQGGMAAAGGGLGGLAGGMLGGGWGFGLSIAGTILGGMIKDAQDLDNAMKKVNRSMEAMGYSSGFTGRQLREMAKALGVSKKEALEIAKTFARYGAKDATLFTKYFGDNKQLFEAVVGMTDIANALKGIDQIVAQISPDEQLRLLTLLKTNGALAVQTELIEKQQKLRRKEVIDKGQIGQFGRMTQGIFRRDLWQFSFDDLRSRFGGGGRLNYNEWLGERADREAGGMGNAGELALQQSEKLNKAARERLEVQWSINAALDKQALKMHELTNSEAQIVKAANAIESAFKSAFKGIIDGSMSAGEAFAAFTRKVADHFLDMAATMLAAQVQQGFLKFFQRSFPGSSPAPSGAAEGAYWSGGFKAFDQGGVVNQPTLGLVGEGGESEYIIPASKMDSALARYAQGARGESVLDGSGGEGLVEEGSSSTTGTIDVRFTSERINEVSYVTYEQFQMGVQEAAKQGAQRGEQATLSRLRNNPSTRRAIGI